MLKNRVKLFLLLLSIGITQGCGNQLEKEKYPHTGDEEMEVLVNAALDNKSDIDLDSRYYITVNSLNVRSEPRVAGDTRLGVLSMNDVVEIVDTNAPNDFVEVRIVNTRNSIRSSERYFLSFRYLNDRPSRLYDFNGRYFVIQNVATEKLRVYERVCEDLTCPHQMVLETDMAVGEDSDGVRSIVGSFRITSWHKFYQDYAGNYPSWYHPSYPAPPSDWRGVRSWGLNRYMPRINGERRGSIRGAFGWYAAHIGPNHHANWTHGTIGWGQKSVEFIQQTRSFMANLLFNPRSSGCARVDNMTIAYLREILPVGTPLIRVYAKEAFLDEDLTNYTQESDTWDYILTTRDSRRINGETSDREKVLARGVNSNEILEEGTYVINMMPSVVDFIDGENLNRHFSIRNTRASRGDTGNIYSISGDDMHGVFYVDAGVLKNYRHPEDSKIVVGGFQNMIIPEFIEYNAFEF